jgi:hypothetical protein
MNTQTTEHSEPEVKRTAVESFFRRHRFYLVGVLAGFGWGIFTFEVFQQPKNPLVYLGGLGLSVLGSTLYRSFRDDQKR